MLVKVGLYYFEVDDELYLKTAARLCYYYHELSEWVKEVGTKIDVQEPEIVDEKESNDSDESNN